jgi:hypothetical protein
MEKLISAVICIVLLVVADRAATAWRRMRAEQPEGSSILAENMPPSFATNPVYQTASLKAAISYQLNLTNTNQ